MSEDVIRKVEFSKLRAAYSTVKEFIQAESWDTENIRLKTRIDADLGLSGDDNYELLEKFVKRFSLDHSKFRYDQHFHSEGELFGSGAALENIVVFLLWLPQKVIQFISLGRFKPIPVTLFGPMREVRDLTFRDMLIWYIEGTYDADLKLTYQIK